LCGQDIEITVAERRASFNTVLSICDFTLCGTLLPVCSVVFRVCVHGDRKIRFLPGRFHSAQTVASLPSFSRGRL
jgi:hypothetical protein